MIVLDVKSDIRGPRFAGLLRELAAAATSIGFVIQGGSMAPEAETLLNQIDHEKLRDSSEKEWPGTELVHGHARVLEYRASTAVIACLLNFADGLFDWSRPSGPEDLFIKFENTVLLETVGHERLAFIRAPELSPFLESLVNDGLAAVCSDGR